MYHQTSDKMILAWAEFYQPIQSDVNKKSDVPVALFHSNTQHNDFSCICTDVKILAHEALGNRLPSNWNAKAKEYSLQDPITAEGDLQLSIGTSKEKGLIPWPEPEKVGSCIDELMPNPLRIVDRYRQELMDPVDTEHFRWLAKIMSPPIPISRSGGIIPYMPIEKLCWNDGIPINSWDYQKLPDIVRPYEE